MFSLCRSGSWLVVLFVMAAAVRASTDLPPGQLGGHATTHILIRFAPKVMTQKGKPAKAIAQGPAIPGSPAGLGAAFRGELARRGARGMRRLHDGPFANAAAAARHGLDRTFVVDVAPGTDTTAMVAALVALGDEVDWVDVDGYGTVAQLTPDDTDFALQYGMNNTGQTGGTADADIDAPEAWALTTGADNPVTIAIVDTGVGPHFEFDGRLVPGINTEDVLNPSTITVDSCFSGLIQGHGTHVAGIAAATGNNGSGVAGVSWGADIMPVRVWGSCSGGVSQVAGGLIWAVDHGADICNVSLVFTADFQVLRDAVNYAHDAGVLVVAAAGNSGGVTPYYPARYANAMAICATDANDNRASFSNKGSDLDVCAPGESIYSTFSPNIYGTISGTSMASPHVAGLAALIKSIAPELTHDEIRALINSSADDLVGGICYQYQTITWEAVVGFDYCTGWGRINAFNAIMATPPRILASVPPDGAIDARQPSEPDGSLPAGWRTVDLTFSGDTTTVAKADFTLTQDGGVTAAPDILAIPLIAGGIRVLLTDTISLGAWTTITHVPSNTSVRIAHLPGDVNADGASTATDIAALIDALSGATGPLPDWSTDLDRSGALAPGDILRGIDLLGGADFYDVYDGATLPPMP